MQQQAGDCLVHYVEHGRGRPVIALHGAGVDHREAEACFEPALSADPGFRRIYPDLPGMGHTAAPETLCSSDEVLDVLVAFAAALAGDEPALLVGHSMGAYYAHGFAARLPDRVAGVALICPLMPGAHEIPAHHALIGADDLGDEEFRGYFVIQTPEMLGRYRRFVAPSARLADWTALGRIGERWELSLPGDFRYDGPALVAAGRQDSTVGYAAAVDALRHYPRATLAVIDGTGHALPHEQPELLSGLIHQWLRRCTR